MNHWKVFLDLEEIGQLWHIANGENTGSICSKSAEIQGLPIDYDPIGTRPMCAECFLKADLAAPAASTDGVDDSYARGYEAGLLDGYTGVDADWVARFEARQKALEAQLAAAVSERDAAVELVNKAHKVLQDVERWLPTTENFDLGANHYSEVHNAWKAGSWIRNYWLHLSEQAAAAPTAGKGTK
jgi:hypothetical protein